MRWKLIFGIAGAVLLALVIAVFVIVATYDFNNLKPRIKEAVKNATGRQLAINGDITLKVSLTPTLAAERVTFQNAPWGSQPDLATMKSLEVKVALIPLIKGLVQVKRLILVEPDLLIETDPSGRSNLEFEAPRRATAPVEKTAPPQSGKTPGMPVLTIDELRIEKGIARFKDGRSGTLYDLSIDEFEASLPDVEGPIKVKMKASYNSVLFEISGALGSLKGLASPGNKWPLDLTLDTSDAQVKVNGTIRDLRAFQGFEIGISAKGKDVANLGKLAGKVVPLKGPFEISGRISDPSPKTIKARDLKASYAGSDLNGTLEVNLSGIRPNLSGSLSSQTLDLKPFWAAKQEPVKAAKQAHAPASPKTEVKTGKLFSDAPIQLDILKKADATLQYRASSVLLPGLSLNQLSLEAVLKEGTLRVKPLRAKIRGGTIMSNFELRPQSPTTLLNLTMKAEDLDMGNLLKDLKVTDALKGNANLDADLQSRGSSMEGFMSGLNGKVVLVMGKGEIDNNYLEFLSPDLRSGLLRLLSPSGQESDHTEIECMVSGFSIANGIAETTALVVDTSYMTVIGDGTINLKTEVLNVGLKPTPKEGAAAARLTEKYGISLGDLARSFRLGGTLSQPSMNIDPSETVISLSKRFLSKELPSSSSGRSAPGEDILKGKSLCTAAVEAARTGTKFAQVENPGKEALPETPQDLRKQLKDFRKELKKFLRDR